MKTMKSKLLASAAMLMLSVIMVTSASFAWFTISTAPEIKGISTQVTANGNLEIALSSGNPETKPAESSASDGTANNKNETWGNLVDLSGYFTDAKIVLKPVVVTTAGAVSIPTWGTDGRISATTATTGVSVKQTNYNGIYTYSANNSVYAFRVDFWLRSNEAGAISLTQDGVDRGAGEKGNGSTMTGTMAEKVKVAFYGDSKMTLATLANGKLTAANICTLDGENAELVSMYVYMDAETLKNVDFENAASDLAINVQFAHATTLVPMSTGSGNNSQPEGGEPS